MAHSPRILIVSDDVQFDLVRADVEARGFEVMVEHDHESALRRLSDFSFDLVVIDLAQESRDTEFLRHLRETPKLSKIFVLALGEWGTGQPTLALSQGADGYEPKPVNAERLVASVERLLRRQLAVAE
jgi:two-component system response regulator RegA